MMEISKLGSNSSNNNLGSNKQKHKGSKKHKKSKRREQHVALLTGVQHHKLMTFHLACLNMLTPVVGSGSPEEVFSRFQAMKTGDEKKFGNLRTLFRNMSKDIFGTWMPKIKFHSTSTAIAGVTGVLNTVVRLRAADLAYFSSLAGIFDEFQFAGPVEALYRPAYEVATTGNIWPYAIGVIDLVDATALASIGGSLFYDTAKIFLLAMPRASDGAPIVHWETRLIGQPDLLWMDTGTTSTDVAWFKTYNYYNVSGSLTYGVVEWICMIQFRQLYGI